MPRWLLHVRLDEVGQIQFDYLADRRSDVPTVMAWWHSFWGDYMGDLDAFTDKFLATLGKRELPLDIVATREGDPIGTAALKEHELQELYPDYRYWLGSVYVVPEQRGQGVAGMLANEVVRLAQELHLPQLYLQTVHPAGGLYSDLGWEPVDRLTYRGKKTLVMVKHLS